jgi:tetratricopeptide (TPR) repeat protein
VRTQREDGFRFHHVLIRDVAYAGITKESRCDLHERFGAWLEQRGDDSEEIVGYHLEQAHLFRAELQPADPRLPGLAQRAGERLGAAGIRAWKRADTAATVNLLQRSVGLLPTESAERVRLLCELGVAQKVAGGFELGEATLGEAIDAASSSGDRRMRLRAQIELAHLRLFSTSEWSPEGLLELAATAIPVFEELGDERALGRTWRHVGYVRGVEGRIADWREAEARALLHYGRSGWSASGCLAELAAALFYGPTPVAEALASCDSLLGEATDRAGQANVLAFMGGLQALDDRLEQGRSTVADAAAIYDEIGEPYARVNNCGRLLGRIDMLAGDASSAATTFAQCCEAFDRMHDKAGLSTLAAELGDALCAAGRNEEADGWLDVARRNAGAHDVSAQYTWRRVQAKLDARRGAHDSAGTLALEAERIVSRTDALNDHGAVLLDLAEVLRLSDRADQGIRHVERSIELFERKGNLVSARAARALLGGLTVA